MQTPVIDELLGGDFVDVDASKIDETNPFLRFNSMTGKIEGAASGGDLTYTHTQSMPSTVWTINHGLGKHPSIVVVDTAGNVWEGDIEYPTLNTAVSTFGAPFSGYAYCN